MNKKLYTQIKNEWRNNLWLGIELVLVSVVMWYVVDYFYVKVSVYNEPRGFDIEHCYLIEMGELTEKSPDYIPNRTPEELLDDAMQMLERLQNRPEIEAASISNNSYPYNGSNSSISVRHDTLQANNGEIIRRVVTPDFVRVFRYRGVNGETPEQLAELLKDERNIFASDNIFERKYGVKLTSFVHKDFYLEDNPTSYKLAASLQTVRYSDYLQGSANTSMVMKLPDNWLKGDASDYEWCVRVKEGQDKDFIERLKADSEKHFRVGNYFIANIRSFKDIRRNYQMGTTTQIRGYVVGMSFLMLNIFLGLLGTFWFRTQQRRSEIAVMKAMGGTNRSIFIRLISEGLLLLLLATLPAAIIDLNLAKGEVNQWMNGTTLEAGRFFLSILFSFLLIAVMIVIGVCIPARKAMKVQPAEVLHGE